MDDGDDVGVDDDVDGFNSGNVGGFVVRFNDAPGYRPYGDWLCRAAREA